MEQEELGAGAKKEEEKTVAEDKLPCAAIQSEFLPQAAAAASSNGPACPDRKYDDPIL